jgi:hypothetical protein
LNKKVGELKLTAVTAEDREGDVETEEEKSADVS